MILTATVKAVRESMDQIVPGPMRVMKWIESEIGKAIKRGELQKIDMGHTIRLCSQSAQWIRLHEERDQRSVQLQLLGAIQQYTVATRR